MRLPDGSPGFMTGPQEDQVRLDRAWKGVIRPNFFAYSLPRHLDGSLDESQLTGPQCEEIELRRNFPPPVR